MSMSAKGTMVVRLTPLMVIPKFRLPTAVRHHKKSWREYSSLNSGQTPQMASLTVVNTPPPAPKRRSLLQKARDVGRAHDLARRLRAGTVWVNCYDVFDAAAPFGGFKQSGNGREKAEWGFHDFMECKAILGRT